MLGRVVPWIFVMSIASTACSSKQGPLSTTPASTAAAPAPSSPRVVEAQAEPAPEAAADPPARSAAGAPPREPNPYIAPRVRRAGDLTIEAPPREPEREFIGRLRSHVEGSLSKGSPRVWVGPQVPGFVPLMEDTMELFLLDRVGDEFMAFYRDPYGASSCDLSGNTNCSYYVALYDVEGQPRWTFDPNEHLSRGTRLEVQDVRYADGTLYFNEACQSYSREAKGKCSALLAYDPEAGALRWRTRHLVSNGEFLVHGDYIVAGYGFTAEPDFIYVVRRKDGKIMHKVSVPKAAERFVVSDDGLLEVTIYPGTQRLFQMRGWDSAKPRLVKVPRKSAHGRSTVAR